MEQGNGLAVDCQPCGFNTDNIECYYEISVCMHAFKMYRNIRSLMPHKIMGIFYLLEVLFQMQSSACA